MMPMMPMQNSLAQRVGMQPPVQQPVQQPMQQPVGVGAPVQGTIARPGMPQPMPMRPGMPMMAQPAQPPTQVQQAPAAQNNIRMRLGMM